MRCKEVGEGKSDKQISLKWPITRFRERRPNWLSSDVTLGNCDRDSITGEIHVMSDLS